MNDRLVRDRPENVLTDIIGIILHEFYGFMREHPEWYNGADWDYWASINLFRLQANRSAQKIVEYFESNPEG